MNSVHLADAAGHGMPETRRADPGSRADNQLAWQREMERAQASSWFAHPPVLGPERVTNTGAPAGARGPARPVAPAVGAQHAMPAATTPRPTAFAGHSSVPHAPASVHHPVSVHAAGTMPAATTRTFSPQSEVHATEAGDVAPARHEADIVGSTGRQSSVSSAAAGRLPGHAGPTLETIEEPLSATAQRGDIRRQAASPEGAPVRVHVQSHGRRADVWLGVDAALLDRVPSLAETVAQSLRRSGLAPGALVCNGRPMGFIGSADYRLPKTTLGPMVGPEESIQPPQGERE